RGAAIVEASHGDDAFPDRVRAARAGAHAQGPGAGHDLEGVRGEAWTGCPDALSTQKATGAQGSAGACAQAGTAAAQGSIERVLARARGALGSRHGDGVPAGASERLGVRVWRFA